MRAVWSALAVAVGCGGHATTGGSGAGGSGGVTVEQLMDTYCARITALGCEGTVSESECRVRGRAALDEAAVAGCSAEFEAALRCATSQPISCSQPVEVVCKAQVDQLETCTSSSSTACERGGGGGPGGTLCYVSCADYSAECTQQAGATADCKCTSGPAAGQTYVASTCDSGLAVADGLCR